MLKKLLLSYVLFLFVLPASASEIQLIISPAQIISTKYDQLEVGDKISFISVKDVYKDNKIYIPKNSEVYGIVDFIHNNGWLGDKAEILLKTFYVKTNDGKTIAFTNPLKIATSSQDCKHLKNYFKYYILGSIRGPEIFIEPDTKVYNIFIER